jgi:hypothetical protein
MNGNQTLKVIVAALLGAGTAASPALAQQAPDFEQWQCRFCPFPEKGVSGSVDASVLDVSDDSARFGEYTGLDEDGVYANGGADMVYRAGEGYAVAVDARDLGLDSRSIDLRVGRQGTWVVDLMWDEIPRRLDDTTRTVYSGLGSDRLVLPSSWVRGNFTSDLTALDANLRDFTLGWDRQTAGLGFEFVQSDRLRYEADWRRQTKEGPRAHLGQFHRHRPGPRQAAGLPDGRSRCGAGVCRLRLECSPRVLRLLLQQQGHVPDVGQPVQRPGARTLGAGAGQSLPPGLLSGSYRFATWDSTLNASYARGRMEQTDTLAAYTINPLIPSMALPREKFDGRVDTTAANVRWTATPIDRLRISSEYRYNERDNQSGQYTWNAIQSDSFPTVPFENPAYGFENRDLSFMGDYRFSNLVSGSAGWIQKVRKRDDQNVNRTEEDSVLGSCPLPAVRPADVQRTRRDLVPRCLDLPATPGHGRGRPAEPVAAQVLPDRS